MSQLFSKDWMQSFADAWNSEPELFGELEKINFNSVIGYGIDGEDQPRGVISIENGKAVNAGEYNGEALNWDLRASEDHWGKWMSPDALVTRRLNRSTISSLGELSSIGKTPERINLERRDAELVFIIGVTQLR